MQHNKFQKIEIDNPVYLHEQGQFRPYSEDFVFPLSEEDFIVFQNALEIRNKVFVVCDGVGGSAKGDMASQTVCKYFSKIAIEKSNYRTSEESVFYSSTNQENVLGNVLHLTEQELDKLTNVNPEWKGMSTTLTYLNLTPEGAVVAWVGDSRVYQIRAEAGGARIVNVTDDHSLVNELFKRGDITAEEKENHPRKNVILRAVSGTEKPTKIDVRVWDNIKEGDYFLLCTDGILDGFTSESELVDLVGDNSKSLEEKKRIIHQTCHANSKDNYSMYLIRIKDLDGNGLVNKLDETATTIVSPIGNKIQEKNPIKSKKWMPFVAIGLLLFIVFLAWKFVSKVEDVENSVPKTEIEKKKRKPQKKDITPREESETDNNTTQQAKGVKPVIKDDEKWTEEYDTTIVIENTQLFKARKNNNWSIIKKDTTNNTAKELSGIYFSEIGAVSLHEEMKIVRVKKDGLYGYLIVNNNAAIELKEENNDFNIYSEADELFGRSKSTCNKYTEIKKKDKKEKAVITLTDNHVLKYNSIENAKKNCE